MLRQRWKIEIARLRKNSVAFPAEIAKVRAGKSCAEQRFEMAGMMRRCDLTAADKCNDIALFQPEFTGGEKQRRRERQDQGKEGSSTLTR